MLSLFMISVFILIILSSMFESALGSVAGLGFTGDSKAEKSFWGIQ
jgi:hypothetical protein